MTGIDRIVACPDCHRECGWCSWYAKNARLSGCGVSSPSGRRPRKKCEWEAMKGTTCSMCGGVEKVRLIGEYVRINPAPPTTEEGKK